MGATKSVRTVAGSSRNCTYSLSCLEMDELRAHHVLHHNGTMADSIAHTDGRTSDYTSAPLKVADFDLPTHENTPFHQEEKLPVRYCKEEEGSCPNQWATSSEQENNSGRDSEGENVEMSTWRGEPSVKGTTETMRMLLLTCVSVGITLVYTEKKTARRICGY